MGLSALLVYYTCGPGILAAGMSTLTARVSHWSMSTMCVYYMLISPATRDAVSVVPR